LLLVGDTKIKQYFRNNDDPQFAWHYVREFWYAVRPNELGPTPVAVSFIQSGFKGDGVHGNFEAIVRVRPPIAVQPDYLDFWYFDSKTSQWNGPARVMADGQPITATGDPVLIQSNWGNNGNFELLVPDKSAIKQYFRNNDDPQFAWHYVRDFGYPVRPNELGATPVAVSFIQSGFKGDAVHGNFEAVVRVRPPVATQPDYLDFWYLDSKTSQWNGPARVMADGQPIIATGDPVLIQSNWGNNGNFELLVPDKSAIKQYFRNNDDPQFAWHYVREFGYAVRPNELGATPVAVGFIQSRFKGDGVHGNFEAVVRVRPPIAIQPDYLDFWYLDSKASQWNGPGRLTEVDQTIGKLNGL
jgi:hypothetical protein